MGSKFYLGGSPSPPSTRFASPSGPQSLSRISTSISSALDASDDEHDDDDENDLPFPQALPREDFLVDDFDASEYLSQVAPHRHQTLDDLRRELRERSQLLSQELLDLVNRHHTDFLDLGVGLRGGDEKIEEMRVGLLGFEREIKDVKGKIQMTEETMDHLLQEREQVVKEMHLARHLVEWDARLERLEQKLMINNKYDDAEKRDEDELTDESSVDDEQEDNDDNVTASMSRLRRRVDNYFMLQTLKMRIGSQHPFLVSQESRLEIIRSTLLLDLGSALRVMKQARDPKVLQILDLYRFMDASAEAVKASKAVSS